MSAPARKRARGPRHYRRWTPAEDKVLLTYWPDVSWGTLRAKLGGRTPLGIWARVGVLGLPRGVPQGFVSVAAAARAESVSRGWLVAFCATHGVTTRVQLGRYRLRGAGARPKRYLDLDLLRSKLKTHFATRDRAQAGRESVLGAARARKLDPWTLRRWLIRAGVDLGPGRGRAGAVLTSVIERVVAANRLPTLNAWAARLGLSRTGLRYWILRTGHAPSNRGPWRFSRQTIAAVMALRATSLRLVRPHLATPTLRKAA